MKSNLGEINHSFCNPELFSPRWTAAQYGSLWGRLESIYHVSAGFVCISSQSVGGITLAEKVSFSTITDPSLPLGKGSSDDLYI